MPYRRIAEGKKEYLYTDTWENGIRKRCWWPLVIVPVGMRRVGGIAMRWWTILYMTINLAVFRLDWRDSRDRWLSMSVTEEVRL